MENLLASWKAGIGASLYSTLVGSVGMGARLLVEEVLEEDLLVLLLLRLVWEDVGAFDEVLTAEIVEDFAEVVELVFLLVEDSMDEDFAVVLVDEGLIEEFEEDFAEVLVLVFLLVEESLTEDFADVLAAS
jgi:hypothetical protein